MNEKDIVTSMVDFIEAKERKLQKDKLTADQAKSDVVRAILDELERRVNDENK